jgi:hypothetical protein
MVALFIMHPTAQMGVRGLLHISFMLSLHTFVLCNAGLPQLAAKTLQQQHQQHQKQLGLMQLLPLSCDACCCCQHPSRPH